MVDWKFEERTKRVTFKIVNLKAGLDVPVSDSDGDEPISPHLLTFEDNTNEEIEIMDLVKALDEGSANANASEHGRACATRNFSTSLNRFV